MYDKLYSEFYSIGKPFATPTELALYQKIFTRKDYLLEPMCGTGRLLTPLVELGFHVDGIDCSASMIEICKQKAEKRQ